MSMTDHPLHHPIFVNFLIILWTNIYMFLSYRASHDILDYVQA